jgi:hypothetical protein
LRPSARRSRRSRTRALPHRHSVLLLCIVARLSRCTTAHPLHSRLANIFSDTVAETWILGWTPGGPAAAAAAGLPHTACGSPLARRRARPWAVESLRRRH